MWLSVIDGKAKFATHFVKCKLEKVYDLLQPFQKEQDGIVCYSEDELQRVVKILDELGCDYVVETLTYEPEIIKKAEGVKYSSRSEAIDHIMNDKIPESLISLKLYEQINALQQDNEALRNRAKIYEDALLGVIFKDFKGAL